MVGAADRRGNNGAKPDELAVSMKSRIALLLKQNVANGTTGFAEDAVSDAKVPSGRNYVGIVIPANAKKTLKDADHALITGAYSVGETFTYYFGGGWSKWKFPTDNDWFNALNSFSEATANPLKVTVK